MSADRTTRKDGRNNLLHTQGFGIVGPRSNSVGDTSGSTRSPVLIKKDE